jgi:hypothetical protein
MTKKREQTADNFGKGVRQITQNFQIDAVYLQHGAYTYPAAG